MVVVIFDTLANSDGSHTDEVHYSTLVFKWNENGLRVKGGYFKVMTHKLCQNANFENGGTCSTIQVGILQLESWTFCQYIYCLGYMTRLAISRWKRSIHVMLRFEENL